MNKAKLEGRIAECGYNLTTFAKAINMPYATLYRKVNGDTEFTISEAIAVCNALNLPLEERTIIFLAG